VLPAAASGVVQGVFAHVKGVESAIIRHPAETLGNTTLRAGGSETTGHAEAVRSPSIRKQVSFGSCFRSSSPVTTNPTQLNYQGSDQARATVGDLHHERRAEEVAAAYIDQLDAAKVFPAKIVTEVTPYTTSTRPRTTTRRCHDPEDQPGFLAGLRPPKIAISRRCSRTCGVRSLRGFSPRTLLASQTATPEARRVRPARLLFSRRADGVTRRAGFG